LRDKAWFNSAITKIQGLWKTVETEKVTGYEHRAPKRRIVKKNDTPSQNQKQTKLEFNDDGSFSQQHIENEKICHSGLFL
jgi:NAD(P)H-dependent flavin oxidoreductase YrpB (nitropropane dioxygenase family)